MRPHKSDGINIFNFKHLILISIFIASLTFFRSYAIADNANINSMNFTNELNNSILFPTYLGDITFNVFIHDINTMGNIVNIAITAELSSFPINASSIEFEIIGGPESTFGVYGSSARIKLLRLFDGWYYGGCGGTEWCTLGTGDSYPFDSYELEFNIRSPIKYDIDNETKMIWRSMDEPKGSINAFFNISVSYDAAIIIENIEVISRTWKIYDSEIFYGKIPVSHYLEEGFVIEIKRKSLIPFLEFILPIEVCYYLLGTSLFIDRRKPADRLRIYVSLFIFSSTFIFSIRDFLPPRNILSLPELLLINLITSSAIIAIFSLISIRFDRHGEWLDNISILISSIIFFYIYYLVHWDIREETFLLFIFSLIGLSFSKLINILFYAYPLIRSRARSILTRLLIFLNDVRQRHIRVTLIEKEEMV